MSRSTCPSESLIFGPKNQCLLTTMFLLAPTVFQFRVNYRGTRLTASAVHNGGYVSPWGGVNWLRRTAVNRGTEAVPRCTWCTATSSRCTMTIFSRVCTVPICKEVTGACTAVQQYPHSSNCVLSIEETCMY